MFAGSGGSSSSLSATPKEEPSRRGGMHPSVMLEPISEFSPLGNSEGHSMSESGELNVHSIDALRKLKSREEEAKLPQSPQKNAARNEAHDWHTFRASGGT